MVYLYLIFLLLAIRQERISKNKYFWRILIPLVYSFLIGFRGIDVGVDTHTYYDSYYESAEYGLGFVEPGFDWINTHLYKLGFEANFSFFVYALITNAFFFLAIEYLSKENYAIIAFCLYFLTYLLLINGIRQDLACAVFLFSLYFVLKKKPVIYVGLLALASLIHASVLMMIPLYFLNRVNIKPKTYLILYAISFVGVVADVSSYIPSIELFNRNYGRYAENMRIEDASWLGFFITNLNNFIALLFITQTNLYKDHKEICLLSLLYFMATNIGFHLPIINRVSSLFIWFTYLLYAKIWINRKLYGYANYFNGIYLLIFFNILFMANNSFKGNYQYYFSWEQKPAGFIHK